MDDKILNKKLKSIRDGMIRRCYQKNSKDFRYYGAKGIRVCKRWRGENNKFRKDMLPKLRLFLKSNDIKKASIERLNVKRGYSPKNCDFIDINLQSRNRKKTRWIIYNGERLTMTETAGRLGVTMWRFWDYCNKHGVEKAIAHDFSEPSIRAKTIFTGERITQKELAVRYGITLNTLEKRLRAGWELERALITPVKQKIELVEYEGTLLTKVEIAKRLGVNVYKFNYCCKKYGIKKVLKEKTGLDRVGKGQIFNGKWTTQKKLALEYGIKYTALKERLRRGWELKKALTTPSKKSGLML